MWSYRQWHDPKGLEPGMLRIISPPFKRVKYHSRHGLRLVSLCVCVCVCVCGCQGVVHLAHAVPGEATVSASAIARAHHLAAFLFLHPVQTLPAPPSNPPLLPSARLFLRAGSHGCCGRFHVPSFPVADCRGGSGCHASLKLTS